MDQEKQFELVFKVFNWFQLVSIGFYWFHLISIEIGVPGNLGAEHFVRDGHRPLGEDG